MVPILYGFQKYLCQYMYRKRANIIQIRTPCPNIDLQNMEQDMLLDRGSFLLSTLYLLKFPQVVSIKPSCLFNTPEVQTTSPEKKTDSNVHGVKNLRNYLVRRMRIL